MAFLNRSDEYWSPLKCSRLTIYGEKWENGKGTPSLSIVITKAGNCKFVVYKNDGGKSEALNFTVGDPSTPLNLYTVIEAVEAAANDSVTKGVLTVFRSGSHFVGTSTRTEKPKTTHNITVSRDEKGRVVLSFTSRGDDPIQFPFRAAQTFVQLSGNGERKSEEEESNSIAKGWVSLYKGLLSSWMALGLEKQEKQEKPNNNRGGRNSRANDEDDDDIPISSKPSGGGSDFSKEFDDDVD
jgi:hypothetical protein